MNERDTQRGQHQKAQRPDSLIAGANGRSALGIARVLLAFYFLMSATGLVSDPVIRMLFDGFAVGWPMLHILKGSVMIAATMVLYGAAVRPAALYLAVFLIWSAGLQSAAEMTDERVAALLGALALFSGMVLVAIDAPVAKLPRRVRRSGASVQPRRVTPTQVPPVRGKLRGLPRAGRPASVTATDLDETTNLFEGVWEEAA